MEEKNITWNEIDKEIAKGLDRFAEVFREIHKQMLKVEEMIALAPKPETLEETMMAGINKRLVKEILKITGVCGEGYTSYDEAKKEAAKELMKRLGL